jgi:hypothetical protein
MLGGDVAGEAIEVLLAVGSLRDGMPRRFAVYQLGRGSAPVVVVSRALSLVAVNIGAAAA